MHVLKLLMFANILVLMCLMCRICIVIMFAARSLSLSSILRLCKIHTVRYLSWEMYANAKYDIRLSGNGF